MSKSLSTLIVCCYCFIDVDFDVYFDIDINSSAPGAQNHCFVLRILHLGLTNLVFYHNDIDIDIDIDIEIEIDPFLVIVRVKLIHS